MCFLCYRKSMDKFKADYNRKVLAKKIPRKNLQILQVAIQQHLKKYPPNQNVGWDPSIGESLFE